MMRRPFYRLRVRFAECELGQNEVAKLAGIAPSTMTARMMGRQPFTTWEIQRLAAVLDISPADYGSYFFDRAGDAS